MNPQYAAEIIAKSRADFGNIIASWLAEGKGEHALKVIGSYKRAEELKLIPESEADAETRAQAEDELAYLKEMEGQVRKALEMKEAA